MSRAMWVACGAPGRQGSLRRSLEGKSEETVADVSRVTVAVALTLDRCRSGERSKAKEQMAADVSQITVAVAPRSTGVALESARK